MRKKGISDFELGMVVGARQAGLSISVTYLLGFSCTTISRVYSGPKKRDVYSEQQVCGQKCLVDARS